MPTYDYECQSCGKTIEIFQSIRENPKRKCPECGAMKLRRLIGGGAGLIFKGSGFYITDYRSDDYKKREKADSDKSASSSGKGDGSSKSDTSSSKSDTSSSKSDTGTSKSDTGTSTSTTKAGASAPKAADG